MGQFFLRTFMGQLLGLYFMWTDFYMGRALLVINGELKNIWPIIAVYFELGPSTTGLRWRHRPYQQLHVCITWLPCQCHQADLSLPMWILCDVAIKWVWAGLWGPGYILWRFQNVMDQTICDGILRNVTRCDLWRSIHDVIWDRHRYCFMMVF